jgi:hypothetical protein
MIVSDKYKYIFFHVQKNAGSSIRHVLIENFSGERVGQHTDMHNAKKCVGKDVFDSYFKFAVIRNPYSRVVSWYNTLLNVNSDKVIRPKSFEDFVLNQKDIYINSDGKASELWRTQYDFLNYRGKLNLNWIIRYENLNENWHNLSMCLFNDHIGLPHLKNWGSQNDYKKYYNHKLRNIIKERFQKDLETFHYDFN